MKIYGAAVAASDTSTQVLEPEDLFRQHRQRLTGLARVMCGSPETADELVQEAFVSLIRNGAQVAPGRELAYLRGVIINQSRGRWRRKRTAERHLHVVSTDPVDARHPGDDAIARDTRRRIDAALQSLSHQQRSCAALVYFGDLSVTETAEHLGISEGSVKTHLHRARAALAPLLEDLR